MRVVGYIRVSTAEQEESGAGLDAQREAITAEVERKGWELVRVEMDVSSGSKMDRPGLNAAVEAVACGDVDGLIVSKLDRLSRSVDDFSSLLERFRSQGWGLVILDLGVDTTTIMGEAMATMAATFAQMERRRIGERTSEALQALTSSGKPWISKAGRLTERLGRPSSLPPEVRRRIVRERARGDSLALIAGRLNAEGVPTSQGGARWWPSTVKVVARG